ncbi:thioredoxin-dependent thiol peroxidase [Falsiporphyromonas endometrii]|uniref:thioredoxin-dependent peroxiredoxin n=1 Tax=Falsiporphyromonas endometrii TaxID=1387297 RepID=A0ABV9K6H0_9PORP|nr:thioredoxin-dependent thiol peroxidase [Porphyromonadaceae bacterium]
MEIGDIVPDLIGVDQDGKEVKRSDYPDKKIALYFYPKDNTSGCTAEACSLRDGYQDLIDAGYQVIGVSKDSAKSHKNFIAKHNLPFPLIVDEDTSLNQTFGVWKEKSMYGRKYMGTERTTFIIDTDGKIIRIIRGREVKTKDHASQLLNL